MASCRNRHWTDMTASELAEVEARCKQPEFGMLSRDESLLEVLSRDQCTMQELGITNKQVYSSRSAAEPICSPTNST